MENRLIFQSFLRLGHARLVVEVTALELENSVVVAQHAVVNGRGHLLGVLNRGMPLHIPPKPVKPL